MVLQRELVLNTQHGLARNRTVPFSNLHEDSMPRRESNPSHITSSAQLAGAGYGSRPS